VIRRFGELLLWAWAVIAVQWMFVSLQLTPLLLFANGFVLEARFEGGAWLVELAIAVVLVSLFATGFGGRNATARAWCFDLLHIAANVASAVWILFSVLLVLMWWIVLPGLAVHAWCFWNMKRLRRQVEDGVDALAGRRAGRLAVLWIFSVMGPPWILFVGSS
jgi:hypothetical protein